MLLGTHLTLFVGPTVPVLASYSLIESLLSIEVTNTDEGRDVFQMTFSAGRTTPTSPEFGVISENLLAPFNRIIIMVTFNLTPHVLIDGIITHHQLVPSNEPGQSTISVTGEDVSFMMDLAEKSDTYPQQSHKMIVERIISTYAQYGLIPSLASPEGDSPPLETEETTSQQHTDYNYIVKLGRLHNFVFYIEPTSVPQVNTAYWGPLKRDDLPQGPLRVNMGSFTNVDSIHTQNDLRGPTFVSGVVQDRDSNQSLPVDILSSTVVPLVSQPNWLANRANARNKIFRSSGISYSEAYAQAQAEVDASINSVTVTGDLDAFRYGDILRARKTVGLTGAGSAYDGVYYVKNVKHSIKRGEYKQSFTLTRDGTGSITPLLPPS